MRALIVFWLVAVLTGCVSTPESAFRLSETALELREIQARRYETVNSKLVLRASMGVLQDMGYVIDEANFHLGIITASKRVDARDGGQVAAAVFVALLGGGNIPIDKEQKIKASIVVNKTLNDNTSSVARMTMQRIIWNTQGKITKSEQISSPEMYQQFFQKLSKSIFLEAYSI